MSERHFRKLTTVSKKFEQAQINYTSASHREGTIMVLVTVPGERWEIELLRDGSVEVERFLSNGEMCGEEALDELLRKYADPEHAEAV